MFVFKRGRFTTQERATFDYFIKHFKDIKDISALLMTGYESLVKEKLRNSNVALLQALLPPLGKG